MKAVIWTDVFQSVVIFLGMLAVVIIVSIVTVKRYSGTSHALETHVIFYEV